MALFGYPRIIDGLSKFMARQRNNTTEKISEQYDDQLNIIMRSYPDIPLSWFFGLFFCSFVVLISVMASGFFIPVWTYFIAVGTGAILVVPLGWLYALSNFQLVS